MAADTRPYKSKEQDGQGNEVIIRDQQLVEQSTVTTMPSGACFETLDIDGRPVKIPRDNMMSIVLECIGIVLNDSSKNLGTNVNKALGLQGNTIGNVTVNDFASVLGGFITELVEPGTYKTIPFSGHLILCATAATNCAMFICTSVVRSYIGGTSQDWITISYNNNTITVTPSSSIQNATRISYAIAI
jgi:hypothetical protein